MFRKSIALSSIAAGLAILLWTSPARAISGLTYDKLTYLTFSGPVSMPGVTLPAGTYRFHLADPATSPGIIQVLSRDGKIAYGMYFTLPDWRQTVTDESTVTFKETSASRAPVVRSLFYPGEHWGYEFMSRKMRPIAAEATPVASAPEPVKAVPVEEAKEQAKDEVKEEAVVARAEPAPAAVEPAEPVMPVPEALPPASQSEVKELPKTASTMPTVALSGLGAILLGFVMSARRRRLSESE